MRAMHAAPPPILLALVLCGVVSACTAGGPVVAPAAGCDRAAAVQEIVWEQDCMGCPQGLRLRFGRDGQALLTATGKPRLRTADVERAAALAPADFDRLAAELAAAGLFGLAPRHEPPDTADGRWTQWRATCAAGTHEVFRREDAGPPALDALDAIVQAWRRRLWPGG
jgi:hypothetical protein